MIYGDYKGEEVARYYTDIEKIMKPYGVLYTDEQDTEAEKFKSYSVQTTPA